MYRLTRLLGLRRVLRDEQPWFYASAYSTDSSSLPPPPSSSTTPTPATNSRSNFSPCWTCSLPVSHTAYFCPYCNKITRALPKDVKTSYFDLLHAPTPHSFSVDTRALERNYRKLAMQLHPDQFSQKSAHEQELSAHHAARLNEAYGTLKSPLRRALYMLEQRGIQAIGEDAGTNATDIQILTETMELRELLDECKTVQEFTQLKNEVRNRIVTVETELAIAIGDTAQIDSAVRTAVRLRYLEKVAEEAAERIRNFGENLS